MTLCGFYSGNVTVITLGQKWGAPLSQSPLSLPPTVQWPTVSSVTFNRPWKCSYTPHVCDQSDKLWQRTCERAENYDWQAATRPEHAARVITATRKSDQGLMHILHDELHWLDVPQCVAFKLCTMVYKCLHHLAPQYLSELCVPVADVAGRRQLHSASRGLLYFPRYNMTTYSWM